MCKVLKIPRRTYNESIKRNTTSQKDGDLELENIIIDTFNSNRKNFGTRQIKNNLMNKASLYLDEKLVV